MKLDICNLDKKAAKDYKVYYSLYANKLYSDENTLVDGVSSPVIEKIVPNSSSDAGVSLISTFRKPTIVETVSIVLFFLSFSSATSLGNEAGPGKNFVAAYDALKKFDTSRPVQYERNNDIVDMGSNGSSG